MQRPVRPKRPCSRDHVMYIVHTVCRVVVVVTDSCSLGVCSLPVDITSCDHFLLVVANVIVLQGCPIITLLFYNPLYWQKHTREER